MSILTLTPDEIEAQAAGIAPGTTIQIPGGTYYKHDGWAWALTGSSNKPIIVEPRPGEPVTIVSSRPFGGNTYSTIRLQNISNLVIRRGEGRRLRVTNKNPSRTLIGVAQDFNRPALFDLIGSPGVTLDGLNLDNGGFGVLFNFQSTNFTIRNTVITNIGWDSPTIGRGRGHGIYAQGRYFLAKGLAITGCYSRSIQSFSTSQSVEDHSILDCLMDGGGVPSKLDVNRAPYTFLSDQQSMNNLVMARCVLRNVVDGGTKTTMQIGENGDQERHGPLSITDSFFYGHPQIGGDHSPLLWDNNYTVGRINVNDGRTFMSYKSWLPDWVDNGNAYAQEFRDTIATPNNTWLTGHPYEEAEDAIHTYWDDGYAWVGVYNFSGLTEITVDVGGSFEKGDWVEVTTYNNPLEPIAIFRYNGQEVTLPLLGIVWDPLGMRITDARKAEKVRLEAFIFKRLYHYDGSTPNAYTFGEVPVRPHLVNTTRGLSGEVKDLRDDSNTAFQSVEDMLEETITKNSYVEHYPTTGLVETTTWWSDDTKEEKQKEVLYTRNDMGQVTTKVTKSYRAGTLLRTVTETITYDGPNEVSRETVVS